MALLFFADYGDSKVGIKVMLMFVSWGNGNVGIVGIKVILMLVSWVLR